MASMVSVAGNIFSAGQLSTGVLQLHRPSPAGVVVCPRSSFISSKKESRRGTLAVRAAAEGINPAIRKDEEKVVDSVVVTELSKPLTAYCRCWRSRTFPLCDGSHVKHNKATEDNVGPLLLKKQ